MLKKISFIILFVSFPLTIFSQPLEKNYCQVFDKIINKNIKKIGVPAASFSTILPDGKVINCAQGFSNIEDKTIVTTNNLFQIGSVTKIFIATLTLLNIDRHKLSLDESITQTVKQYGQWLPKIAEKRWGKITISQLLNMTSGIYSYTDSPAFNMMWQKHPKKIWHARQVINIALSNPSYFKAGKGWHYSDTNYYLIGLLLERVNRKSLADQIYHQLLKPLLINHVSYVPNEYDQIIADQLAHGYGKNLIDRTDVNMSQAGAAGAMIARPSSLARWLHALFSEKILSPIMLKKMLKPYSKKTGQLTNDPKDNAYGLGIFRSYYSNHGGINWVYLGGTWGYLTWFQWCPKTNILFVVSLNIGMGYHDRERPSPGYEIVHGLAPALYNQIYNMIN